MIDPRAEVHPDARLAADVTVGPWTIIGPDVEIGAGTVVASHVVIKGPTRIGSQNRIFQFATVGEDTPDLKYKGEPTRLEIGDHNIIREGVTIHRGTVQDRALTSIGDYNLLMAYVHVGHDCRVGNHTVLVNNASLAGHVDVGDWAILSGYCLVHQFVKIGCHSFAGAGAFLNQDLPAYVTCSGSPAEPRTINVEGLRRRGFSRDQIAAVNRAYKTVYRRGLSLDEARLEVREAAASEAVLWPFLRSIEELSSRGLMR